MKKFFWFINQSLKFDFLFLKRSEWNIFKKIHFIFLKYFLILKHFFKKFKLGIDFLYFGGKEVYYDSKFGLSGYQRILISHQYLIQLNNIKNIKTVVDIGANVGFFSKLCRDIFPESKIFAFEPIPKTFECLKNNFIDDKNTSVFNLAISDFNGTSKMNFNEQDSAISQISNFGNIDVNIKTLDSIAIANNIKNIDILKIDTETFEAHVLKGAYEILKNTKYLFLEITMENSNKNYTISSLFQLLSTEYYEFQLIGFRNFGDKGEGAMPIMDALLVNTKIN